MDLAIWRPYIARVMTEAFSRFSAALADRYRLERELGAGGMATVYLAHDLRHDRPVALKVLKPELAAVIGADRFLTEIKTTANLQHPHILALFDSGQVEGMVFYVMPYVDGESLRDRLVREKQLPIDEALRITTEVADALHHAHSHGIIHRDIKPENILLQGGHALVADFGIALAVSNPRGSRMTESGLSLGTPTYMSPEQATGERVLDERTDVYALGCVLYEMLTGDAPFTGSSQQAIVTKVLTEKPAPIIPRRDRLPVHVEQAVLVALEKLPADRWASAAEFSRALSGDSRLSIARASVNTVALAAASEGAIGVRRWRAAALAMGVLSVALSAVLLSRGTVEGPRTAEWFELPVENLVVAASPDGSGMAQCIGTQVQMRRWDRLTAVPVAGTDCDALAFSPDGRSLAIVGGTPTTLRIVTLDGSAPARELPVEHVDDLSSYGGGIDWASDDRLYLSIRSAVMRVDPRTGRADFVTRADSLTRFYGIDVLPGALRAVLMLSSGASPTLAAPRIASLDLRTGALEPVLEGINARFMPPDKLVVVRADGSIGLVRVDGRTLRPESAFVPLPGGDGTGALREVSDLAVGGDGTLLVLRSTSGGVRPVLVDRAGVVSEIGNVRDQDLSMPRVSPDGTRIVMESTAGSATQPLVVELGSGAYTSPQLPGRINGRPSWDPSGTSVTLVSDQDGVPHLYAWRVGSAAATPLMSGEPRPLFGSTWSRDGTWLLGRTDDMQTGRGDIVAMRPGVDSMARSILASPVASEYAPALSPDGHWLAYVSNEREGRYEVWVTEFPDATGRWQISNGGGTEPVWSPEGNALYYLSDDGYLMSAEVTTGTEFRVLSQSQLFSFSPFARYAAPNQRNYDVMPDGSRFVLLMRSTVRRPSLVVVRHWASEADALLAGR